jgi:hypothetical protein
MNVMIFKILNPYVHPEHQIKLQSPINQSIKKSTLLKYHAKLLQMIFHCINDIQFSGAK